MTVTLICIFSLHIWLVKVSLTSYFLSLVILVTWLFGGIYFFVLWGILLLYISWKADILPTAIHILLDPLLMTIQNSLNLWYFSLTTLTFIKVFILNLLIVYKITFSVRFSWLIDWFIKHEMLLECDKLILTY